MSHSGVLLFLIMSSFVPVFLVFLSLSTLFRPCGLHLLSSRRGREKQRKERNANFITTATECMRREKERGNVTEMATALFVSVLLNRKDQGDSLSDIFSLYLLHFASLPCGVNYVYFIQVYISVHKR